MEKKLLLFFVLILFLAGCAMGQVREVDEIIINQMERFTETKVASSVTITDSEDIELLIRGIEKAKKQPGVAEMPHPEFELLIGNRSFFLWLDGQGTVMDQEDTHITYLLENGVGEQFEEIIHRESE